MGRYGSNEESSSTTPVGVPVLLVAEEVNPSRNTFEGRDEPQIAIKWVTQPDGGWIFDRINPWHMRDRQDGTPSKAKQLGAALEGRIALQVKDFWVDDESFEYGFDVAKQQPAGRFRTGMKVAAELVRRPDQQGVERLRVSRYLPASVAGVSADASTITATAEVLSPDGQYRWDGQRWAPIAAAPEPRQEGLI